MPVRTVHRLPSNLEYRMTSRSLNSGMGESIKDYQVMNLLGKGGFACVYSAKATNTGQEVAIKMIDKKMMQAAGMVGRVRNEVEIQCQLKHPSILELYSYFEDNNYVYLVLEMCHNGEMNRYLKTHNKVLTEEEARHCLKEIVLGMLYLHSHGILHRDLTLANILLTKDMHCKIADFGLAAKLNMPNEKHYTMCGTPNYISPEIATRSAHGLESDVWSLGCMLYTFLAGRPPFDTEAVKSTLNKVVLADYVMPEKISAEAKDLILKLLRKNPDERISLSGVLDHPFMTKSPLINHHMVQDGQTAKQRHIESSVDSGLATMATLSTATTFPSRLSSRSRPIKALPLPNLTPLVSQEEGLGGTKGHASDFNSCRVQEGYSEARWRGNQYDRHPPSPPVRDRAGFKKNSVCDDQSGSVSSTTSRQNSCMDSVEGYKHQLLQDAKSSYHSNHRSQSVDGNNKSSSFLAGVHHSQHSELSDWTDARHHRQAVPNSSQPNRTPLATRDDNGHEFGRHNMNDNHWTHVSDSSREHRSDRSSVDKSDRFCGKKGSNFRIGSSAFVGMGSKEHSASEEQLFLRKSSDPKQSEDAYRNKEYYKKRTGDLQTEPIEYRTNSLGSRDTKQDSDEKRMKWDSHQSHQGTTTGVKNHQTDCSPDQSGCLMYDAGKARHAKHRRKEDIENTNLQKSRPTPSTSLGDSHRREQSTSEVKRRHTQKHEKREQRDDNDGKSLVELTAPLNARRLRPIRQRTRNAVVSILDSGEVCLEFLKSKEGRDRVVEVCRISEDGMQITLYHPNGGKGFPVADAPPSPPQDHTTLYTYHDLPTKYWRKYQYAAKFVQLVRSKTPKVTLYTKEAKCMLMENSPGADFEACFYEGTKLHLLGHTLQITDSCSKATSVDVSDGYQAIPADTQTKVDHMHDVHRQCLELEAAIAGMESVKGHGPYFPIIICRKPTSSGASVMADKTIQNSKPGAPPVTTVTSPSVPPPVSASVCSYDGTVFSMKSEAPNTALSKPTHGSKASSKRVRDCSPPSQQNILKSTFVPNVGWASQMATGEMWVQYNDGTQIIVGASVLSVKFIDAQGNILQYGPTDKLPDSVKSKLAQLSAIIEMFVSK
ncbi:serine/threonine-protein kinase PLK4-like isoform X2 [Acanthaster planci]|uniref:Serine/threonine-protein kinase PLK4 n=1 Tax=Acanthaster planci TaxID=133434 RepID=A0A8B7Y1L8_ACAPL|nr:serine/threonine-protein kinase PLK4-like isoform X2 [Acanthaster planci]